MVVCASKKTLTFVKGRLVTDARRVIILKKMKMMKHREREQKRPANCLQGLSLPAMSTVERSREPEFWDSRSSKPCLLCESNLLALYYIYGIYVYYVPLYLCSMNSLSPKVIH